MAAEKNEYLVDVAGERHYQSQTRPYREAFTKWRNKSFTFMPPVFRADNAYFLSA